jgi:hypothetical protein
LSEKAASTYFKVGGKYQITAKAVQMSKAVKNIVHFGEIRFKSTGYFGNIRYHEFCAIDLERVVSGLCNCPVKDIGTMRML